MRDGPEYVVQKRIGFLPAVALGGSAVLITSILCATGIVGYSLAILNHRSGSLLALGKSAIAGLPELKKSLPPVLADAIEDERRPEYVDQIEVAGRLVPDSENPELYRVVLEVKNTGKNVVSLLPLHTVLSDADGSPLREWIEYAATPIAVDNEWRGPLMPGAVRQIRTDMRSRKADRRVSCEISDLRVWTRTRAQPAPPAPGEDA
jgi:hypothetical protein